MVDGWKTITRHNEIWDDDEVYEIFVEGGRVMRGVNEKHTKTLYPYKATKTCLENACGVRYETFMKGFKEFRYELR